MATRTITRLSPQSIRQSVGCHILQVAAMAVALTLAMIPGSACTGNAFAQAPAHDQTLAELLSLLDSIGINGGELTPRPVPPLPTCDGTRDQATPDSSELGPGITSPGDEGWPVERRDGSERMGSKPEQDDATTSGFVPEEPRPLLDVDEPNAPPDRQSPIDVGEPPDADPPSAPAEVVEAVPPPSEPLQPDFPSE